MITAFPTTENERTARAMLRRLIEQGHVDESAFPGKSVFSVVLDDWEIDLMSSYGAASEDLEDSDDDEGSAPVTYVGC